jgi:hypothetical protein
MALDMEESNVASHRNYLATEEAKRTHATTIHRSRVVGPRIRWVSRGERMKPHQFYAHQNFGFWNGAAYRYYPQYSPSQIGLSNSAFRYYPMVTQPTKQGLTNSGQKNTLSGDGLNEGLNISGTSSAGQADPSVGTPAQSRYITEDAFSSPCKQSL